jgi:hydroxyacylglutathione hydrolase
MPNELQIKQFRYSSDNFGYVIFGKQFALAIDGGAVSEILAFTAERNLSLIYITHTHSHPDHTMGAQRLMDQTGATRLTPDKLIEDEAVALEKALVKVYRTPGHTRDSLVFHWNSFLITGDTLFNGTVGNCFSGDLRAFYQSISHLCSFPDDTVVYAGHDYVEASMQFARVIEPENSYIEPYLKKYDPRHVFSTLADEKKVNPYLRFNTPELTAVLKKRGLATDTAYDRWKSLMSIE